MKSCDLILIFSLLIESTGYIWVQMWKNWRDAQSYCRQHYTDLPTIHNSEEQNQLKSIVSSSSAWVWIGLFQDSWEWSDKRATSSDTGQQVNHLRVQDLVTVLACQQPSLGNGFMKDVIYSVLLSAMDVSFFFLNK